MSTITDLRQQREQALRKARAIAEKAQDANVAFTKAEKEEIDELLALVDQLAVKIAALADDDKTKADMAMMAKIRGSVRDTTEGAAGYLGLKADLGQRFGRTVDGTGSPDIKALVGAGVITTDVPIVSSPVAMGRPAQGLLDVLPAVISPPVFAYLRQTVRTNNAVFVADGATKPTSVFTLVRVEGKLEVLAHLSEPIPRYWLEDSAELGRFVGDELGFGLRTKLENAVLNGDGTGPNPLGFGNVSGTQLQEFTTDAIRTARAALTKIEVLFGDAGAYYVMHPTDWEAIETAQLTNGEYVITEAGGSAPVERATRRLWGQPVALSLAATVGTGWLASQQAARLRTDGQVRTEWKESSDDFEKNLIRARNEGRFDLEVSKPMGLVEIEWVATP